jgi:hypothetical protein
MSQNKIDRMQAFIERLSVVDSNEPRETMSLDDFLPIEKHLGYKLPDEYKYFCQEIGRSLLDYFIHIYCINDEFINQSHEVCEYMIERIDYGLDVRKKHERSGSSDPYFYRQDDKYIELLKSALILAEFNGDRAIFWDLRTYQTDDDSYDIYWCSINCPDAEVPILIGRDFNDFIQNFCYGKLAYELIPDFGDPLDREISYTYL